MEKAKRFRHIRVPAKASLWYVISGAVARGVGVLGTPLFTRILAPSEYGLFPLFNTWLAVITPFVTLELSGGIIYRAMQRYELRRDELFSSALGLTAVSFGAASVIYFAASGPINRLTGLSTGIFALLLLQILSNAILSFYTARAKYEYRYKSIALINIFSALLGPIISLIIIELTSVRAEARIIGGVVAGFLFSIPICIMVFKSRRKFFSAEIWGYLLRRSIPLLPHYAAMSVILRAGEIWVERIFGKAALGKYSVAMSLGLSLTMITGGIISALAPWMMRKLRADKSEEISSLVLTVCRAVGLGALLILSFAPEALSIITPAEYHDAIAAVYPLALTVIPMFLSGAVMSAQMYFEKSYAASLPSIAAAILSVTLCATLLRFLPYTAAGIFALICYTLLAFLNMLGYKRVSGRMLVRPVRVLRILALTSVYALLLYFLRDVFLSRVLLAVPLIPPIISLGIGVLGRVKEA